jgi:hypothetical protein
MLIYTSTKSKPKRKPKAEREQYSNWLASHGVSDTKKRKVFKPLVVVKRPLSREVAYAPSLNPHNMAIPHNPNVSSENKKKTYTGDKIIGIGTLHKSNAVPVFNTEEAKDIAKMRR